MYMNAHILLYHLFMSQGVIQCDMVSDMIVIKCNSTCIS